MSSTIPKVTTRTDEQDGHERLAILIEPQHGASVDLVTHEGRLLCRMNIFDFGDGRGDLDVFPPEGIAAEILTWGRRRKPFRKAFPAKQMVAINLIKPEDRPSKPRKK